LQYGKAGVEITPAGKVKICPGLQFNKCAEISITIFENTERVMEITGNSIFDVDVKILDEDEQIVETIKMQAKIVSPERFNNVESLSTLHSEDIILLP